MRKINLGCGGNRLKGWENHDMDVDISKPLPFENDSADFIFAEHVVEHVDAPTAFRFFQECYRVLNKGGVLRACVPSISRVFDKADDAYLAWTKEAGFGDGTLRGAIAALITGHGHLAVYSYETLEASIYAAGFADSPLRYNPGISGFDGLRNIEGHHKVIGEHNNWVESIVVEGVKE